MYEDLINIQKTSHKFYRAFVENKETIFQIKLMLFRLHKDKQINDDLYDEFMFIINRGENNIKKELGIND